MTMKLFIKIAAALALFVTVPVCSQANPVAVESPVAAEKAAKPAAMAVVRQAPAGSSDKVFVLPINGPIDKSLLFVFRRAFKQVESMKPQAIIIELETPGGGLRETEEIIAWMRSVNVPIYAFVNTHAQSAGAIISLGTDKIFMAPGSRIGSALPIAIGMDGSVQQLTDDVKEKILSDTRSLVRGLAQEHGYSEELAMAMVDPLVEVKIGDRVINSDTELLNLTAKEAAEVIPPATTPLLAAAIVPDVQTLLDYVGIKNPVIERFEETSAEQLARWITMMGPLLLALGLMALYVEFKTPGFGLPGIAGITLLAIYFFGHYVAGLAGAEYIALVVVGLVLLAVEIFIFPTVGALALAGIVCIVTGLVMGLVPYVPTPATPLPGVEPLSVLSYLQEALIKFLCTVAIAGVGVAILARYLPHTPLYRNIVLKKALSKEQGFVSHTPDLYLELVGKLGTATTMMRPAGIAEIDGQRFDVVSTGDLIAKGSRVRVTTVEGSRIAVERLPDA